MKIQLVVGSEIIGPYEILRFDTVESQNDAILQVHCKKVLPLFHIVNDEDVFYRTFDQKYWSEKYNWYNEVFRKKYTKAPEIGLLEIERLPQTPAMPNLKQYLWDFLTQKGYDRPRVNKVSKDVGISNIQTQLTPRSFLHILWIVSNDNGK